MREKKKERKREKENGDENMSTHTFMSSQKKNDVSNPSAEP